jgi:hypothetical protein
MYGTVTAAVQNLAVTSGSSVHTKSAVSRLMFYVQSHTRHRNTNLNIAEDLATCKYVNMQKISRQKIIEHPYYYCCCDGVRLCPVELDSNGSLSFSHLMYE